MTEEYRTEGLESRLGFAKKLGATCQRSAETISELLRNMAVPYKSVFFHPEKPFYALGNIVKNVYEIPVDFYQYLTSKGSISFDKKVSRSLALAELAAVYGANRGAHTLSYFSGSNFVQAGVGGFIGSEVTTAAVFFLTYMAFTSVINVKSKDGKRVAQKLASAVKETCKACLITIPVSLISFASADIGIASLAVLFGAGSGTAATIGAVAGSVLYAGTAKVAIQNSANHGYMQK